MAKKTKKLTLVRNIKDNSVAGQLRNSADVFESRNPEYGAIYRDKGKVMKAFFPNGVNLQTPNDMLRYNLLSNAIGKLQRYAANFNKGGHEDSLTDGINYQAMLKEVDADILKEV